MSAITVRDVWVEYGDQIVLERINLEIASGAFVSIVGPSGCGKSTFLRLILGQERPTRGDASCSTACRCRTSRGRTAASCSSAIRCSRISPCWAMCWSPSSSPAARCSARLRGAARRAAIEESEGAARGGRARAASRQVSERALRRHAAAPGDRPGARAQAARAAARRAVRRARSRHARADARADQAALARLRHDRDHGHPRPQGSVRARHPPHRLRPSAHRSAGAGALRRRHHLRPRSHARQRRARARLLEGARSRHTAAATPQTQQAQGAQGGIA